MLILHWILGIPKREIHLNSMNVFFQRLIDISQFNELLMDTFLATIHYQRREKNIFWKWTTVNIFTAYLVHEVIYTSNLDMVEYFRKLFVSQKVVTYIYLFIWYDFGKRKKFPGIKYMDMKTKIPYQNQSINYFQK